MFFVGACTGHMGNTDESMIERIKNNQTLGDLYPRLELILQSLAHPDKFNAKMNLQMPRANWKPCAGLYEWLDPLIGKGAYHYKTLPIGYEAHLEYKFLLSLDGHGCAWLRVPWILYSNSILVMQDTLKEQWFYQALTPHKHYWPIKEDISDILDVYEEL